MMAHLGNLKTDIKKVGIADRIDLTSVSLPGLEIRFLFHPGILFPIFWTKGSTIDLGSFL
jgi:hypothetical protein